MACGFWFNFGGQTCTALNISVDGTVTLTVGTVDVGGSRASLSLVVAEELGIPYAPLAVKGRNLVATCPECGRTFVEKADAQGELTTDNYGAHYVAEHKKAAKPATRTRKSSGRRRSRRIRGPTRSWR